MAQHTDGQRIPRLEKDMITGAKVAKMVARRTAAEANESRTAKGPTMCDTTLRLIGDNAILVSISTLHNWSTVRTIVECGNPTEVWHAEQNTRLRSSTDMPAAFDVAGLWRDYRSPLPDDGEVVVHQCFGKVQNRLAFWRLTG